MTADTDPNGAPPTGPADDDKDDAKKSVATTLVQIAQERYEFGVSDTGETFAVPRAGARVTALLRGGKKSLRAQLAREYFQMAGRTAPQQALADALLVIEGIAQEAEDEAVLHLRVARQGSTWWLDLGDQTGAAVRVRPDEWAVVDEAPLHFKRTALNAPLPRPAAGRGHDLAELWSFLNVEEPDRPLVAAWLIAALVADVPHPALGLFGEQGVGKTTAAKVLVSTIDPSPVPARKPPKDAESWVTAAGGSWVVGIDNLSDIPGWLSDSICRAVTGDGDVRRRLYTDGDLAVFAYRRCVILNGIDLGSMRGDLADRMLPITLRRIPDDERLEEEELWPKWAAAHPRILGALLDLAAGVAGVLPSVRLASKPRMADFARVLAAVDLILETDGLERYRAKHCALAHDSLDGDDFVVAIRQHGDFEGTSKELLSAVTPTNEERWRAPKGWPANARSVTTKLNRQAPVMRKAGWFVENDDGRNKDGTVRWTITPPARDMGKPLPPNPPHPSTQVNRGPSNPPRRVNGGEGGSRLPLTTSENGEAGQAGHQSGPSLDGVGAVA